jgi:DNA modification methylase
MSDNRSLVPLLTNSPRLQVEEVPIAQLKRKTLNPRRHPEKQITMLSRSIDNFGFLIPGLVDEENHLLSGEARVEAAARLGMPKIPVIRVQHLSDAEKRAYIIADNKLAELGSWDPDILRRELQFFVELDVDFDFSTIGFETPEVDLILDGKIDDSEDDSPAQIDRNAPAVSQPGDLWLADQHRILCGNALTTESYQTLLGSELAKLIVTDPPYNVPIGGHVGGSGSLRHREFVMASGEMSPGQFEAFLMIAATNMSNFSADGSLHYIFMDWRHAAEILAVGKTVYSELKNVCVWRKTNAGMGSLYRSQHELVFLFKNGAAAHINNVNLGAHGRNRSNVWDYDGFNSFGKRRDELLAIHPTVKPVALIADVIRDASARGDLVLDPFGGSGSTIIAAEKTRRRCPYRKLKTADRDRESADTRCR